MPLDPKRVQAVFLAAVECHDAAARAVVLDRECSTDLELRQRVEALLNALDRPESLLDQPIVGPDGPGTAPPTRPGDDRVEGTGAESPVDASERFNPTVGVMPGADYTRGVGTVLETPTRAVPAISGYEILGELGRGGMGVVYRARQVRLNRACALKMILAGAHASPEAATRFLAEAEAVARLQHANIVQIHHIGEADGLPYFELEYVDGGSLDRRLDGTPWPARRAAELIESAARGVAEAHRQGIVHRDLKPANILLAADGTPKITDFGLAKLLASDSGLTRTDSIMGSPGYMAPEQAEGRTKQVGPPADIYALGVILYELLTGGPPFRGTTPLEILDQVKNAEPVPPSRLVPGLPSDVETIALKCLQKEPGKRYESATALAEDLKRFVEGRPIEARRVSQAERAYRWCKRNPAVAGLLATVAALVAAGFAGAVAAALHFSRIAASERNARREAVKQSQAAEASFAHARKAVDESFTTVSESKLLNVPGLRGLRAELLGSAITFYEQFVNEHSDDPSLLRELLRTRLQVAGVLRELGRVKEATDAYKTIAAGCEQALVDEPDGLDFKSGLAEALYWAAALNSGEKKAADFRRVVALREEVLKARPADVENKQRLAQAWHDVSKYETSGPEELAADARSASLHLELAEALPDDPDVLSGLALSFDSVGLVFAKAGSRPELCQAMYARAVEHSRDSLRLRPNDLSAQRLPVLTRHLAGVLWNGGHKDEAIAELRKSVEVLAAVARANPEVPLTQTTYLELSQTLAEGLTELNKRDEAADALMGSRTALERLSRETPAEIAGAAGAKVDFARRLGETKANLTAEQKAIRGEILDQALSDYREAVAGGWKDDGVLKKATALKVRPGYAELLAEAESAANKPAVPPAPGVAAVASAVGRPPPMAARPKLDVKLDRATLQVALGVVHARIGNVDETFAMMDKGLALFDELVRERPGDSRIATGRVDALLAFHAALYAGAREGLNAGKVDESPALLKKADALYAHLSGERPNDPKVQAARWNEVLGLAGFDRDSGRWPECFRILRDAESTAQLLARDAPAGSTANRFAALALARIGSEYGKLTLWEEAASSLRKAYEIDPNGLKGAEYTAGDRSNPWYRMALLFLYGGETDACRRLCDRMLSEGATGDVMNTLRTATLRPNLLADWRPVLDLAGKVRGQGTWTPIVQGFALVRAGRSQEAVDRFGEGADAINGWPARAIAHYRLGQRALAREWLARADRHVREDLAQALAGSGFTESTGDATWWDDWLLRMLWTREAHELIDGKPWPDATWMRLQRARALARVGEAEKADGELAAAVAARRDDSEVRIARVWVNVYAGRSDRARDELTRAEWQSSDPMTWIELGRWLAQLGEHSRADQAFARAASLAPDELNRFIKGGWFLVGPYPYDLAQACPPEHDPDPSRPVAAVGSDRKLSWQHTPTSDDGRVDLSKTFNADHIAVYALNYVASPDERAATLLVGGDDLVRVWLNGRLIHQTTHWWADSRNLDRVPVMFRAGRNTILAKINNVGGPHHLILRLADSPFDRGVELQSRALRLGDQGRWALAAETYSGRIEREPVNFTHWYHTAALWARSGDRDGYRRHCQRMVERFGRTDIPEIAARTAMGCLLLPLPGPEGDAARLLAERAIALSGSHSVHPYAELASGLADYRAGRFDEAIARAGPVARGTGQPWYLTTQAHMVHAMALLRLGRRDEARAAREEGVELYRKDPDGTERPDPGDAWFDRLICEVLGNEVEGLFLDAAFPANPFAH